MRSMFQASSFNQDISNWDTSRVCISPYISSFHNFMVQEFSNLSRLGAQVETMSYMFTYASSFDQDISGWNVSQVNDMEGMFNQASSFNQDLSGWNVSQDTEMRDMFEDSGMSPLPDWYVE